MRLSPGRIKRLVRDGYAALPGAVSPALLAAARAEVGRRKKPRDAYLSELSSAPALMNLLSESPLWKLAESLLGEGMIEPCTQAQIAVCFPSKGGFRGVERAASCHIDSWRTVHAPESIIRHTLTVAVLLNDVPRTDMGNLVVFPGSHALLARQIKKYGIGSLDEGLARTIRELPPLRVTGKAGDAVLLHYQLAHDKTRNVSARVRSMVYFRLSHVNTRRDGAPSRLKRALTDLWLEWPGIRARSYGLRRK